MKLHRRLLVPVLASALALSLSASPAQAMVRTLPNTYCDAAQTDPVVFNDVNVRIVVVNGQLNIFLPLTCQSGADYPDQTVPVTYEVNTITYSLAFTFTPVGATSSTTFAYFSLDQANEKSFDRLARQLANANSPDQEARILNEMIVLLAV